MLEADQERIREASAKVTDWQLFVRIVKRNRISPLVNHALKQSGCSLPEAPAQELSQRSLAAARKALAMARESLALQRAFESSGLAVMIVKGAPLALLAYGELGLKESWDIDVLTSRESAARATQLLLELGYDGAMWQLSDRQIEDYARHAKDAEFHQPETGITVELHWALVDQESLLPSVGIDSPSQDIAVAGGSLRTLATTELFAYLCVHGAIHCWSRLKWLADLRALLGDQSAVELERLHRHASDLGAARSAGVALVLCHDLLGLRLRDAFLTELRRDRAVRALSRNALLCLSYRDGAREHERLTRPWWRTIAAQFFLAPGLKHGLARVPFFWNPPIDRLETPLPPGMGFLYPFLRLPLWLGRVGKSMFHGTK